MQETVVIWKDEVEEIEENSSNEKVRAREEFLAMISRGGLLKPSDELFTICCNAQAIYRKLTETADGKKLLTSETTNPRKAYVEVLTRKLKHDKLLEKKCTKDHTLRSYLNAIGKTMFNLFAKNLISDENSKIAKSRKRVAKGAKTPLAHKLKKVSCE